MKLDKENEEFEKCIFRKLHYGIFEKDKVRHFYRLERHADLQGGMSTEEIMRHILNYFEREGVDFSMSFLDGAYQYENREFVSEKSLALNLIGADEAFVHRIGRALKTLLNQENVLISKSEVEVMFT